jgi:hypothetical protein
MPAKSLPAYEKCCPFWHQNVRIPAKDGISQGFQGGCHFPIWEGASFRTSIIFFGPCLPSLLLLLTSLFFFFSSF